MLIDKTEFLLKYIEDNEKFIKYNESIFSILEGDLLSQLFKVIDEQLSNRSAKLMKSRAIPINVLKKIIDKLSKLYFQNPLRTTENPQNQELIDWYSIECGVNAAMQNCNESFNAYKNTSVEILENPEETKINVRAIPSHQFLVWSDNIYNPLKPTGYIKFMGTYEKNGVKKSKYWVYTKDEFLAIDDDKDIIREDMEENEGINPFGVIPFSYLTRSDYMLIPERDTDTLRMVTIVPLQLSEISFASMFLANPIIYGVDLDIENLNLSPAQFWDFKSTQEGKTPQVDVINPNLDMNQQTAYARELLNMWLESRNIKAGSISSINATNAVSGIALAIREMDTTQDRQSQEKYFAKFENDFWKRLGSIHNTLAQVGRIENRKLFVDPDNMKVNIEYAEQKPIVDEQTLINNTISLYNSGLISKEKALRRLYPEISEEDLALLLAEIDGNETIEVPSAG